jgi:XTP/dITP diphosphohydrolase
MSMNPQDMAQIGDGGEGRGTPASRLLFVLATGNVNKAREFSAILAPHAVAMMPGGITLPPEGVTSFRENALIKARALAAALGADDALVAAAKATAGTPTASSAKTAAVVCLADDSGLEVEALGWRPGVTSARYAGEGAGDVANYTKLLAELEGYSSAQRRARFVCALAAVVLPSDSSPSVNPLPVVSQSHGLREYVVTGQWWGTITAKPHGDGGFGYDPVFLPEGSDLTVAQLPQELKDQVSHRALAGRALLDLLEREGLLVESSHRGQQQIRTP